MAKNAKKVETKAEQPTFTYRHIVVDYRPVPKFHAVCPKCNK